MEAEGDADAKTGRRNNLTLLLPLGGPRLTPSYRNKEQSWQPAKSDPRASEASERCTEMAPLGGRQGRDSSREWNFERAVARETTDSTRLLRGATEGARDTHGALSFAVDRLALGVYVRHAWRIPERTFYSDCFLECRSLLIRLDVLPAADQMPLWAEPDARHGVRFAFR